MIQKTTDDKMKELKEDFLYYLMMVLLISVCIIGTIILGILWIFDNFIFGGVLYLILVEPPLTMILKWHWSEMKSMQKKMKQHE